MANVTDLANNAAAVAAGYIRTQTDRGATATYDRFKSEYGKHPTNGGLPGGGDMGEMRAVGTDNASQAQADTNALAALNAQRRHYYGGSAGRTSGATCPQSPGGRGETFVIDG
jgi:hypothetical protein